MINLVAPCQGVSMEFSDGWDFEAFADYLRAKGLHEDVVSAVLANRISELFLSLTEGDLKELAPAIGDRLCLRKILEEARKVIVLIKYSISHIILTSTRAKLLKVYVNNHMKMMALYILHH